MAVFQRVAIDVASVIEDAFHGDVYDAANVIEAMADCFTGKSGRGALTVGTILGLADVVGDPDVDNAIALLDRIKAVKAGRG